MFDGKLGDRLEYPILRQGRSRFSLREFQTVHQVLSPSVDCISVFGGDQIFKLKNTTRTVHTLQMPGSHRSL